MSVPPAAATLMAMPSRISDPDLARFLQDDLGIDADAAAAPKDGWSFTGPLWLWRGTSANGLPTKAAWYFITIDGDVADAMRTAARGRSGGFGSVKVSAVVGETRWQTSLFPSKEAGGYLLPVKASVRKKEGLVEGDMISVSFTPV